MTDPFTTARISKLLTDWKQKHGRDISMSELIQEGFSEQVVDEFIRKGLLTKYQVVAKGGRRENRFKLATDWRSLNG
jgi:protoporphyrinogen oxidase